MELKQSNWKQNDAAKITYSLSILNVFPFEIEWIQFRVDLPQTPKHGLLKTEEDKKDCLQNQRCIVQKNAFRDCRL